MHMGQINSAILGDDKIVHLSWKREVLLAIGMNISKIVELRIKLSNCKQDEPVHLQRMKRIENTIFINHLYHNVIVGVTTTRIVAVLSVYECGAISNCDST